MTQTTYHRQRAQYRNRPRKTSKDIEKLIKELEVWNQTESNTMNPIFGPHSAETASSSNSATTKTGRQDSEN